MNALDVKYTLSERMIPYNHRLAPLLIRDSLFSLLPEGTEHIFVMGIGSNVISGDSLVHLSEPCFMISTHIT